MTVQIGGRRYDRLKARQVDPSGKGYNREGGLFTQAAALEFGAMVFQNMFGALSFLKYRRDDDFVDRLSYFYTSSFLVMMAVLVSFKQFGGRPLECWVPAQFTNSWEAYAEMYCWAQNTYWVPMKQQIPTDFTDREEQQISYYQWVPFFLLAQAVLFYIPCMLWRLMNDKSGIRLHDIISAACHKDSIEPDFRHRIIDSLSKHIEACLKYQHSSSSRDTYTLHRVFKCFNIRYYDSYVTGMYLFTKMFYVANCLINLVMINYFLQTDNPYQMYGAEVLRDLIKRRTWQESGNFPRVTLCDFEVRVLGHLQRHTVQCVLVINIFNEKIFILLWMWFTLLLAICVLDSIYWFSISLTDQDRLRFLMRHLELTGDHPATFRRERRSQVLHFLKSFIKVDGVFVLRMIAAHAGVMFCTELTEALWQRYLAQHTVTATATAGALTEDSQTNHHSSDSSIAQQQQQQPHHHHQQQQQETQLRQQPFSEQHQSHHHQQTYQQQQQQQQRPKPPQPGTSSTDQHSDRRSESSTSVPIKRSLLARIFSRRTNATPPDNNSLVDHHDIPQLIFTGAASSHDMLNLDASGQQPISYQSDGAGSPMVDETFDRAPTVTASADVHSVTQIQARYTELDPYAVERPQLV